MYSSRCLRGKQDAAAIYQDNINLGVAPESLLLLSQGGVLISPSISWATTNGFK